MRRVPRIVAFGGGTGLPRVLRGLSEVVRDETRAPVVRDRLTGIVAVTDDGGIAIDHLSRLPGIEGHLLPACPGDVVLEAEFADGAIVRGETAIAARRMRIRRLRLIGCTRPLPDALRALVNADVVVVGPGSLYTSVLPHLLVSGVAATLSGINAVRVLVANLMTERGETEGFDLADHLAVIGEHAGTGLFDYVLVNNRPIDRTILRVYEASGVAPIAGALDDPSDVVVVERELATWDEHGRVRHQPQALARAILELARHGRARGHVDRGVRWREKSALVESAGDRHIA